jgi:hypothetical protein
MRRPCPGPGTRLASARLMGVAFSRAGGVPVPPSDHRLAGERIAKGI